MKPARKQPLEVVDHATGGVLGRAQRGVVHAVRVQPEDGVDVVGGVDAGLARSGDRAGIDADLVGVVDAQTDELETRAAEDRTERVTPDVPGPPLDHTVRHVDLLGTAPGVTVAGLIGIGG